MMVSLFENDDSVSPVYSFLDLAGRDGMGLGVPMADGSFHIHMAEEGHGGSPARPVLSRRRRGLTEQKRGVKGLGNDDSGEASEVPASWLLNGIDRQAQLPLTSVESQLNRPQQNC